ncbi:hypothetical protein R8Z50_25520 [Longispora sp. K20-0274]|uniref:hypothetical protein n=1 Tax=Longispora sp. K20-0274 TaxID=3088255 RepID=UPI00399A69A9
MTDDSWIPRSLAANPSAPDDLLLAMAATGDENTQLALAAPRRFRRLRLPAAVAAALAASPHWRVRSELTVCAHLPDDILIRLATDPDRRVRVGVVVRPQEVIVSPDEHAAPEVNRFAPEAAYASLVRDDWCVLQEEFLLSPDIPDHLKREMERELLRRPDARLHDEVQLRVGTDADAAAAHRRMLAGPDPARRRVALASSRFPPPADLVADLLADDATRLPAIGRVPLTADLARSLATDDDPRVRAAVAGNPTLPLELLRALAADSDETVTRAVLERPHVPLDVLDSLDRTMDTDAYTRVVDWLWAERHDLALVARYAGSRQVRYRRTVARMPGLPAELVARLAADEDYPVRLILTENNREHVPTPVLLEIVRRWDGYTAAPMLRDPRVPDEVIDELSRSEDPGFRWRVFHTGRLNRHQLARLADDPDPALATAANPPPPPSPEEFRARLDDPSVSVRDAAARHPDLPVDLMWRLWRRFTG